MLNIVIPMAGAGSRFSKAGYADPKPLIRINGVPMIKVVIDNLRPKTSHRFIFICQNEHVSKYDLVDKLSMWSPGCEIVGLNGLTEGAACTVLAAQHLIDGSDPIMIANSDQYIDTDIDAYVETMLDMDLDGLIMTMEANDPKWSFVGFDALGHVSKVVEKEVISNDATVGIYNFRRGADFVSSAHAMMDLNLRVNGEFYVAPVYNQMIGQGAKIGTYSVGSVGDGMYGLGTPADLDYFLAHPISRKIGGDLQ